MSNSSSTEPAKSAPKRGRAAFLVAVALLLLFEVYLLGRAFKTDILVESPHVFAPWVRATRHQTPWGLAVVGAMLALGGRGLWTRFEAERSNSNPLARAFSVLAAHCAAFGCFYLVTAVLLDSARLRSGVAIAVFLAWLGSGVGTLFTLGCFVFPPRRLARFLWNERWIVLGGLIAGSIAFVVLQYLLTEWPYWEPLARATLELAHLGVRIYEASPVYDPAGLILGTPAFPVHITRACTGYEGTSLFSVFFVTFLVLQRRELRFPHALLLLPLGMLSAWLLNVVRIVVLVWIGDRFSPELAIDGFHAYAGWPLVILVALGAVLLARKITFFASTPVGEGVPKPPAWVTQTGPTVNPAAVYLGPLIAVLATLLVGGALFAEDPRAYPLRVLAGCSVLVLYRREYRQHLEAPCLPALALGAIAAGLWILVLDWWPPAEPVPSGGSELAGGMGFLLLGVRWFGFVLVAPLTEELALRGYLARRLEHSDFESVDLRQAGWVAFLLPAVVFGALHDHILAGTVVGLVLSLATQWRGRIVDAVAAHATANVMLACVSSFTGESKYWS